MSSITCQLGPGWSRLILHSICCTYESRKSTSSVHAYQDEICIAITQLHRAGPTQWPACDLCPVAKGVMKRTVCGKWAHLACALWTPETITTDEQLIDGLSNVSKVRAVSELPELLSGHHRWQDQ